jgi:hypothetical protein
MSFPDPCRLAVLFCAFLIGCISAPAIAQAPAEQKPAEQQKGQPAPGDAAKSEAAQQRKVDEIAEASHLLSGPAGNPECVWLGRRVVSLLWRDDLDTAFRHLDVYDRFGCPGNHVQATFRCLVRQGHIDAKATETLNARVHSCWVNPAMLPSPSAASASSAPTAPASGTNPR